MNKARRQLKHFDLHTPAKLAKKLGVSRQRGFQILEGINAGTITCQRIGRVIKVDWKIIYDWLNPNR